MNTNEILLKEKSIIEAQNYEIDQKQIAEFYGLKLKKPLDYNVIQKKVIFAKENSLDNIDPLKKYSSYLVFRQLLQKEYDLEGIKEEIKMARQLMKYSENIREDFYHCFHLEEDGNVEMKNQDLITRSTLTGETNPSNNVTRCTYTNTSKPKASIRKSLNNLPITADEFLKKCIMLSKKKKLEDDEFNSTNFKLFSNLNIPSDKYAAYDPNINKLNIHFYNQKQRLLKCFNREERFEDFIYKVKDSLIKETPDSLTTPVKDKFSSNLIDVIYDNRNTTYYNTIDTFFNKYDITPFKVKDGEKELFENIYSLLTKNNYLNFLSFLYSRNSLFKFIYDEFCERDTSDTDYFLDSKMNIKPGSLILLEESVDRKPSRVLKVSRNIRNIDYLNREEELGLNNLKRNSKQGGQIGKNMGKMNDDKLEYALDKNNFKDFNTNSDENSDDSFKNIIDDLLNKIGDSYAFLKIGLLEKIISLDEIEKFFSTSKKQNQDRDIKKTSFYEYIRQCAKDVLFDYTLLIDENKKLQILLKDSKVYLEEKMDRVIFHKIPKKNISNILDEDDVKLLYTLNSFNSDEINNSNIISTNKKDESFKFNDNNNANSISYYLMEITKGLDQKFYLFKIYSKNSPDFETSIEKNFKLENVNNLVGNKDNNLSSSNSQPSQVDKTKELEKSLEKSKSINNSETPKNILDEMPKKETKFPGMQRGKHFDNFNTKEDASILNSSHLSSISDLSDQGVKKVIKNDNIKKANTYRLKNKKYEFEIDNENYVFEIVVDELKYANDKKTGSLPLERLSVSKVEFIKTYASYCMDIKEGNNLIFTIMVPEKDKLEEFYIDLQGYLKQH